MSEDREPFRTTEYQDKVRDDHYLHWLALIAVTGYMWQLHGVIAAVALFIGLIVTIMPTNIFVLVRFASVTALNWSRWG